MLRIVLASLFLALGGITYFYPNDVCRYVTVRYDGLMKVASSLSVQLPSDAGLFINPHWNLIYFGFFVLGAVFCLFKIRLGILTYGFFTVLIGGLLHLPYTTNEMRGVVIAQTRRFICTMIIFLCLIIAGSKSEIEEYSSAGLDKNIETDKSTKKKDKKSKKRKGK